ncbi:MAG: hypothetical protein V4467_02435 [Patescibacteria group bacterium]
MILTSPQKNKGFIALMSTIIISTILMAIVFTTNMSSFYARFDALDGEFKRKAFALAESCANETLLRLAKNYSYDPTTDPDFVTGKGLPISIEDGECLIVSVLPPAPRAGALSEITIITQGIYRNTFSNLKVEITTYNPGIASMIVPTPPNIDVKLWTEISGIE